MRLALVLAVAVLACARPVHQWKHAGKVHPSHALRFTFALQHRNLAEFEKTFWSVSDPDSDSYGDFLSASQIADMIAPPEVHHAELIAFLTANNASKIETTRTRDIIRCEIPAGAAESVFGTTFHVYTHPHQSGKTASLVRGKAELKDGKHPECSFTKPLPHVVQLVPEVCNFPVVTPSTPIEERPATRRASLVGDYQWPFHPDQLKQLYKVPADLVGDGLEQNGQAVTTTGGSYDPADLATFLANYAPNAVGQDIGKQINVTNDPSQPEPEPTVDVEYAIGMAPKVFTFFWGLHGVFMNGAMWINIALDYFNYPTPPKVFTVSYTTGEEWLVTDRSLTDRMNVEFQKMGAAGGSLLFASTDYGVGCTPATSAFSPMFPQSSPYITNVGGTKTYYNSSTSVYRGSGGGFSEIYSRPAYQDTLVSAYLSGGTPLPPSQLYNATGRAYPDVAFEGQNMGIVRLGSERAISGTSAACPGFAGLVSLLNVVRIKAGKPALGFLNPLFYKMKETTPLSFTDVDMPNSNNYPCDVSGWDCPCQTSWKGGGFFTANGWNPVVGLGMPNFEVISQEVLTLPKKFRK